MTQIKYIILALPLICDKKHMRRMNLFLEQLIIDIIQIHVNFEFKGEIVKEKNDIFKSRLIYSYKIEK